MADAIKEARGVEVGEQSPCGDHKADMRTLPDRAGSSPASRSISLDELDRRLCAAEEARREPRLRLNLTLAGGVVSSAGFPNPHLLGEPRRPFFGADSR